MGDDKDDYDVFLENWQPSETLAFATTAANLTDPVAYQRMLDDHDVSSPATRTRNQPGIKTIDVGEERSRALTFIAEKQAEWSADFRDYVLSCNVPAAKFDEFCDCMRNIWVMAGNARQQDPRMMRIKASIQGHDEAFNPSNAGKYVINRIPHAIHPLFTPEEMQAILDANSGLITARIPDYLEALDFDGASSLDDVFLRRGLTLDGVPAVRTELNYLSSYSLALGPPEQFAQMTRGKNGQNKLPMMISAPVSAFDKRIVAFAAFIDGMTLNQMEFIVAPPLKTYPMNVDGVHGGVQELSF